MDDDETRPRIPVELRGRIMRLAVEIDPGATEKHAEHLALVLDHYEALRQRNAELRQAMQRLRAAEREATGGTPEFIQRAARGQQRPGSGGRGPIG